MRVWKIVIINIYINITAMVVLCCFLVQNIAYAYPVHLKQEESKAVRVPLSFARRENRIRIKRIVTIQRTDRWEDDLLRQGFPMSVINMINKVRSYPELQEIIDRLKITFIKSDLSSRRHPLYSLIPVALLSKQSVATQNGVLILSYIVNIDPDQVEEDGTMIVNAHDIIHELLELNTLNELIYAFINGSVDIAGSMDDFIRIMLLKTTMPEAVLVDPLARNVSDFYGQNQALLDTGYSEFETFTQEIELFTQYSYPQELQKSRARTFFVVIKEYIIPQATDIINLLRVAGIKRRYDKFVADMSLLYQMSQETLYGEIESLMLAERWEEADTKMLEFATEFNNRRYVKTSYPGTFKIDRVNRVIIDKGL